MAEGISSCKKNNEKELLKSILDSNESSSGASSLYKEPSKDSKFYGLESHFNENVIFYKDITIHGKLNYNFLKDSSPSIFNNLVVVGVFNLFWVCGLL